MASGGLTANKITATTGCALINGANGESSLLNTKNLSLICTLTTATRAPYDSTKGYCFDWNDVNGSNGGILFGN
jgi:hypothetical protein